MKHYILVDFLLRKNSTCLTNMFEKYILNKNVKKLIKRKILNTRGFGAQQRFN